MIKNTYKAISEYVTAYKQASEVRKQATDYIKANYREGSELYESAMKTASETFRDALTPLKDKFEGIVKDDFSDARKAIEGVVAVPPSEKILAMLPVAKSGKMTETEFQMIAKNCCGYMDTKLLYEATGKYESFGSVENVMSELEALENSVEEFFRTYSGEPMEKISYNNALMLNGSSIKSFDEMTDDFISKYTVQASDN